MPYIIQQKYKLYRGGLGYGGIYCHAADVPLCRIYVNIERANDHIEDLEHQGPSKFCIEQLVACYEKMFFGDTDRHAFLVSAYDEVKQYKDITVACGDFEQAGLLMDLGKEYQKLLGRIENQVTIEEVK